MSIELNGTLVLIGAGKMGGAMLQGWLGAGIAPKQIVVLDPHPPPEMLQTIHQHKLQHNPDIASLKDVTVVLVAVKPQIMDDVLAPLAELAKSNPLVISVVAGKTLAGLARHFGDKAAIIRSMPNTPAAIGRGITAFTRSRTVTDRQADLAESLLSAIGEVVRVESEDQIDWVTAVSGSGPAYVFYLTECMAAAGEKLGLSADLATRLARATIAGSGELMKQSGIDAATLRQNVTSPNGTTYAALQVLMADDGLKPLMEKAIVAAARRAKELAG